jgi:hypothetical protein
MLVECPCHGVHATYKAEAEEKEEEEKVAAHRVTECGKQATEA